MSKDKKPLSDVVVPSGLYTFTCDREDYLTEPVQVGVRIPKHRDVYLTLKVSARRHNQSSILFTFVVSVLENERADVCPRVLKVTEKVIPLKHPLIARTLYQFNSTLVEAVLKRQDIEEMVMNIVVQLATFPVTVFVKNGEVTSVAANGTTVFPA